MHSIKLFHKWRCGTVVRCCGQVFEIMVRMLHSLFFNPIFIFFFGEQLFIFLITNSAGEFFSSITCKWRQLTFLSPTLHNTHIFLRKKVKHLIFFKISNILWFEHHIKSVTISIFILWRFQRFVMETKPKLEPIWTFYKSVMKIHKSS